MRYLTFVFDRAMLTVRSLVRNNTDLGNWFILRKLTASINTHVVGY